MPNSYFLGGVTNTTLHFESDGTMHVEEKLPDVSSILDHNQRARDHRFSAASPEGTVHEVANIDLVTLLSWAREAGLGNDIWGPEFSVVMEKKLSLPENAKLLAAPKVRDPRVIIKGVR